MVRGNYVFITRNIYYKACSGGIVKAPVLIYFYNIYHPHDSVLCVLHSIIGGRKRRCRKAEHHRQNCRADQYPNQFFFSLHRYPHCPSSFNTILLKVGIPLLFLPATACQSLQPFSLPEPSPVCLSLGNRLFPPATPSPLLPAFPPASG